MDSPTYTQIRGWFTAARAHRASSLGNVASGVGVGIGLEATRHTAEQRLRWAIGGVAVTAPGARLGGVLGVNKDDADTSKGSLVAYKLPQHAVGPEVVQMPGLFAAPRCVRPYPGQVFQGQGVTGIDAIHQPAAYLMQSVSDEAPLTTGKPCPQAFSAGAAFGIELASHFSALLKVVASCLLELPTTMLATLRGGRQNLLAEVYADNPAATGWCRDSGADRQVDIPLTTPRLDQLPTLNALGVSKEMPLIVADSKWNLNPPINRGQRDYLTLETQGALIVADRAALEAACLPPLTPSDPADSLHYQVSRQPVALPHRVVDEMVQVKPAPCVRLPRRLEDVVASISKHVNRALQRYYNIRGGVKPATHCQRAPIGHRAIITQRKGCANAQRAALLPMPFGLSLRAKL